MHDQEKHRDAQIITFMSLFSIYHGCNTDFKPGDAKLGKILAHIRMDVFNKNFGIF